ncbi:similar to Saccharomyces cerevisiae YGL134W PCL10 Pho85p cyclin [Maudiozyma saulgeensis]|uniref:Similar to Saccharomyces cerevisiae YGL134W PCL10 Pho85p cyclin n=1 Tax=Maudiozyma saulgeensis TaxID=1789683 RepID=A0A1X7R783_9SACH|nr:similar to Saccharomyces cerevisiae YGL134W PCL10 Pho85p cyclin [Kazachstania saulgeensis]
MEHDPVTDSHLLSDKSKETQYSMYDDDDDIGIDLPLKPNILQNRNFLDIEDEEARLFPNVQKVRFQIDAEKDSDPLTLKSSTTENDFDDIQSGSGVSDTDTVTRNKNRESVEELLQHASEVNDYVAENIDKLKAYPTNHSASSRNLQRILSGTNPKTESLSTFDLSDVDTDDAYDLDHVSTGSISHSGDNKERTPLEQVTTASEIEEILSNDGNSQDNDDIDSRSMSNQSTIDDSPPMERQAFQFDQQTCINNARDFIHRREEAKHEEVSNEDDDLVFVEISVEEAMNNFERVIQLMRDLSHKWDTQDCEISETNKRHFDNFIMKNTPSLSYQDFISRVQSKCMFGSIVFQSATYLLQVLFMRKDSPDQKYKLKHRLQDNEIHRIIIACVRVATKLIEDQVHSHQYFCKVCGVTKKLLTKLEVSLVLCLKDDDLVITRKMLAKSVRVIDYMIMDLQT